MSKELEVAAWCAPWDANNRTAFAWPGTDRGEAHLAPLYSQKVVGQLVEQRAALLEAAKLIIDGIDLGGNCDEAYDQLRDAIALAQGDAA